MSMASTLSLPLPAPSAGSPARSLPPCPQRSWWRHHVSSLLTCSLLVIFVLALTPSSPQAETRCDIYACIAWHWVFALNFYHLWLVKASVVIIGDSPKEFIIKELIVRDCFKKFLHGDEESSGSAKNDCNKQRDSQPHQLQKIKSLGSVHGHLHQRLCSKSASVTGNNGRVFLYQLL